MKITKKTNTTMHLNNKFQKAKMTKTFFKWIATVVLFTQCQCIDFQNNPFFQHIKLQSTENLANFYPNNPFFQAISKQTTVTRIVVTSTTARTTLRPFAISSSDTVKNSDICGRPLTVNELIFHGHRTNEGDWPWIVALFYKMRSNKDDNDVEFICGANLINKRYVISAGHCVTKLNMEFGKENYDMFAYLGLFDLSKRSSSDIQKKKVDKIHVHPNYKSGEYSDSDISVLRLATPAEYTLFVRPICLWKWKPDLEYVVGSLGRIIGWGRDENKEGPTNEPQLIDLPIVSQKECRSSHIGFHYFTSERTFCAGLRNNSGPCNGDSGSGLILRMKDGQKEKWFLRGVVSQSLKKNFQCDLDQYIVFTDVPQFNLWLKEFTEDENI